MNSIHDAAILFAATAGFCMVIGGMVLIYKGSLVLAGTDSSTALSIEWKKDFKLNTQAPGIAFFIIGLTFSSISIYASKQDVTDPIFVEGTFDDVKELVTVTVVPSNWAVVSGSNGVLNGKFTPDTERVHLKISAPGYKEEMLPQSTKSRLIKFDKPIKLTRLIATPISAKPENIVAVSSPLPAIGSEAKYGVAR